MTRKTTTGWEVAAIASDDPIVALTLGDPAGIGCELIAKLLAKPDAHAGARPLLVGDPWLWQLGQRIAGVAVETDAIDSFEEARRHAGSAPLFLALDSVAPDAVKPGVAAASGGASVLSVLTRVLDAAAAGFVDAICFAPLNKQAMKLSGMHFEDELHFIADHLGVATYVCEFNTLGTLWTSRVSSHIPLADAAKFVTKDRIKAAAALMHQCLRDAGFDPPRIGVCAFNPHGGEGGACGREEIDVIAPAVAECKAEGMPIEGPFPADTIFLRARAGQFDGIVTMYHDQGQIAIKLLGFERGVTVQGGLPIPVTTPAHGTAYDIVGKNTANMEATAHAFSIARRMGASQRALRSTHA